MVAHKFLVAIAAISLATGSFAGPCIPKSSIATTTSGIETSSTASPSTEATSSTETIISSTTEALSSTETVTSFTTTESPSTTAAPTSTTTTEEDDIIITMAKRSFQDGPPMKKNVHCEVNGSRKEISSLDQFGEERPGVPISIEGCFEKCKDRANTEPSCKSFSFSYGGHGQPLCNLFDESVSGSVSTLNHAEVSLWFDLVCGSPSEKGWEPSDI